MSNLSIKEIEKETKVYWDKINLLQKIEQKNKDGDAYHLLDGPPYANNQPHIGHFRNTVYKDFYIRYAMMRGKDVLFKPGFDTHGLPIENIVQKRLGIHTKEEIDDYGREQFAKKCKENAVTHIEEWKKSYKLLGAWYGWKEPYLTYNNSYIESVWATFKRIWDKNLVYKGKKPVYWCPVDQTTMAGYEVTDSYEMVTDPMVIVKFKRKGAADEYFTAYTTTPWTLPSNTFLAVNPEETYVKAKTKEGTLILAEERLEVLEKIELEYNIIDSFKGKQLDGAEYEPLIDCEAQRELAQSPKAHRVYMSIPLLKERVASKTAEKKGSEAKDVHGHFVTVDSGTGIVHAAPGHGKSDYEVGQHYDVPLVSPLDDACKYTEKVEPYQDQFVKDADENIVKDLESQGSLLHTEKIQHKYPVSWRSEAPLIFRLSEQWFFDVQSVKDKMLEYNEDVNWQPSFAYKRFKNWVENAEDWNFTRQRYWGIPVPIFEAEDGDTIIIGSKEDLVQQADQDLDKDFDLHLTNKLTITKDGKTYQAHDDVFDVWFDSGNVPFGAYHYPFENKETIEKQTPVSRINEAQDQIRGWFYALMYTAAASIDKPPYETVSMTGWVMAKNGEKLSKSKGNFKPVPELVDKHGADNIRFYYCWEVDPSSEMSFNEETIQNEVNKVVQTLFNLQNYVEKTRKDALQNIDSLDLAVEDKWVLSRLDHTIKTVREGFETFKLQNVGSALLTYIVEDLSRTYVQLTRERTQQDETPLSIIHHALTKIAKLMAPVTPHIAERLYQQLYDKAPCESVHLERIPSQKGYYDEKLEESFETVQNIITAGLAARDRQQISLRHPIPHVLVDTNKKDVKKSIDDLKQIVTTALNIDDVVYKEIQRTPVASPRWKNIGADHGEDTQKVGRVIKENADKLESVERETQIGEYTIKPNYYTLSYTYPDKYGIGETKDAVVAVPPNIPPAYQARGNMREVLRRIQVARKNKGLDPHKEISVSLALPQHLVDAVKTHEDAVKQKANLENIEYVQDQTGETFTVDDEDIYIDLHV